MADKSKSPKLRWLQSLDHDEFLEQAILPLFKRMGYEKIYYCHPELQNLDAMFRYEDSFGEIIHAFLHVKLPSLSSDNLDIQNEILANFERTFSDEHSAEFKPKECIIATLGQIDDEVFQAIQLFSSENHYDIRLLDGEKILQLAEKYRIDWTFGFDNIIGESPKMKEVKEKVRRVAQTDANLLLLGESGTGKGMFAQAIHSASPRAKASFIPVNCGAIPETLLESELFGHEKGASTGATFQKPGIFELANKGTIFLNELGDAPLSLQVKLLQVIESKRIQRLGGTKTIEADVRIIATTNQDLEEKMRKGEFREDLYYRLNIIIFIPPLRERKEDIPLLAEYFLQKYSVEMNRKIVGFSKAAMDILKSYNWPGNIRELGNTIENTVVFANNDIIQPNDLPRKIHTTSEEIEDYSAPLDEALKEFKKRHITKILKQMNGNRTEAAKQLKIQRTYLSRLIKELNIGD